MPLIDFIKNFKQRLNLSVNFVTVCEWLLIMSLYPIVRFSDPQWFVEYGIVENLQLLVLLTGVILSFCYNNKQKLFVVVGFFMIFLIMRETNMGRIYFCARYLSADEVCKWNKFKHSYLVDVFRIIYISAVCIYFIKNKLWQTVIKYLKNAPLLIFDIIAVLLTAFIATISEFKSVDNEILEETCELLCYIAVTNCIWRYIPWQPDKN